MSVSAPNSRSPYFLRHLVTSSVQGWLLHTLQETFGTDIFFLQVGANDGSTFDPLTDRIRNHHWRGILVEPVPNMFAALQANYAGCEGLTFVQAACADFPGTLPFYQVKNEDDHPWEAVRGLSSLNRDVIRSHFGTDEQFAQYVDEIAIDVVTAEHLLNTHRNEHVHLLLVDTEGADARVLDGFDIEGRRPEIVMIEHLHLSAADKSRVHRRMYEAGYLRCVGVMDTFFYQPSLCSMEELDTLSLFQNPVLSLR